MRNVCARQCADTTVYRDMTVASSRLIAGGGGNLGSSLAMKAGRPKYLISARYTPSLRCNVTCHLSEQDPDQLLNITTSRCQIRERIHEQGGIMTGATNA